MCDICKICNYSSDIPSNYRRHMKSNKHKKKVKELEKISRRNAKLAKRYEFDANNANINESKNYTFRCVKCGKGYAHASSLSRHIHQGYCVVQNDNISPMQEDGNTSNTELIECKSKIKELENKIIDSEVIFELFKKEKAEIIELHRKNFEEYKQLLLSEKIGNTYNISIKNFVQKNFKNAPALEAIEDYKFLDHKDSDELIDKIINRYENKKLHKFLGKYLIGYYRKEDPGEQSIWNSDTSRLTYIIKELLADNESIWNRDQKGVRTKEKIIKPLLEYLENYIKEYMQVQSQIAVESEDKLKINRINKKLEVLAHIKKEISEGSLADQIVSCIAPSFYLNKEVNDEQRIKTLLEPSKNIKEAKIKKQVNEDDDNSDDGLIAGSEEDSPDLNEIAKTISKYRQTKNIKKKHEEFDDDDGDEEISIPDTLSISDKELEIYDESFKTTV